jgi:hypothetical protein
VEEEATNRPADDLLLWWEGEQIRVAHISDRKATDPIYIDPECDFWAEAAQLADEED